MRRRRRRNAESGVTTFLLVATGLVVLLYVGKKLSEPKALP